VNRDAESMLGFLRAKRPRPHLDLGSEWLTELPGSAARFAPVSPRQWPADENVLGEVMRMKNVETRQ
jgi:hypothetical protein